MALVYRFLTARNILKTNRTIAAALAAATAPSSWMLFLRMDRAQLCSCVVKIQQTTIMASCVRASLLVSSENDVLVQYPLAPRSKERASTEILYCTYSNATFRAVRGLCPTFERAWRYEAGYGIPTGA